MFVNIAVNTVATGEGNKNKRRDKKITKPKKWSENFANKLDCAIQLGKKTKQKQQVVCEAD